ncbi:MAG: hypothetical protein ACI4AH_04570 [Muribaculaceae bacterium]
MEEKRITEQESLSIITQMIARTRHRLCLGDGNIMLLWGYLTVGVALLVTVLLLTTRHPAVNWLWFLIMIIGGTITPHLAKKKAINVGAKSHIDVITSGIWTTVGYLSLLCVAFCLLFLLIWGKDCWSVMFMLPLLIVGMAEALQGIVIKERSLVVGGAVGMATGIFTMCCIASQTGLYLTWYMPLFIVTFAAMMIVPGHILNHKARRQK